MTSFNWVLDNDDGGDDDDDEVVVVVIEVVVEVVTDCPLRVVPRPTTPTQRSLSTH